VQSFQPRLLKFLGRIHGVEEARSALEIVQRANFESFSLDLIYANPGQTLDELAADLDSALVYQPPHLSAYNLTFEEGTPFHHEYRAGKLKSLSEDEEIAMAELIETKLATAGLLRYEISNYARTDCHSRHNSNYWRGGDYLGLGAGAHSYRCNPDRRTGRRWSNEKNPAKYIAQVKQTRQAIADLEEVDRNKAAAEFMFLGLRMTEGISPVAFRERFGEFPWEAFPRIKDLIEARLLEVKHGFLRLTKKGLLVANSIFVEFM